MNVIDYAEIIYKDLKGMIENDDHVIEAATILRRLDVVVTVLNLDMAEAIATRRPMSMDAIREFCVLREEYYRLVNEKYGHA